MVMPRYLDVSQVPKTRRLIVKVNAIFGNGLFAPRWGPRRFIVAFMMVALLLAGNAKPASACVDGASKNAGPVIRDDGRKDSPPAPADGAASEAKSEPATTTDADKFKAFDDKLKKLEDIVKQQQSLIDSLQNRLSDLAGANPSRATAIAGPEGGKAGPAAVAAGQPTAATAPASGSSSASASGIKAQQPAADCCLQIHIGSATITPVGFVDAISVFRTTNVGSGIGTNFGSIPFENTIPGNLTENRFSLQNSRVGARIDAEVKGARVIGYWESDFLGGATAAFPNLNVSTNSDIFRMRLFWVDIRRDKLEVLGGQSWSMMTPNRVG